MIFFDGVLVVLCRKSMQLKLIFQEIASEFSGFRIQFYISRLGIYISSLEI